MEKPYCPSATLLVAISILILPQFSLIHSQILPITGDCPNQALTYIVHVKRPENTTLLSDEDWRTYHLSFLPNATLDSGEPRLVYSYREAISGFAARLTPDEVGAMQSTDGYVHAFPDRRRRLLTTHTPDFLGLSKTGGFWAGANYGSGVIIGILDTAVDATHPSFADTGIPQPPRYWRGGCDSLQCNNKIIGFRTFNRSSLWTPAAANNGTEHGTHVASIAAGGFVGGADVLGSAKGIAAGMAPKAHLAIYQVCSNDGCADSDVLAGIDQAIYDGVDLLSISIGSVGDGFSLASPRPFYEDSIAIGSFSAMRHRILTVAGAGNDGPLEGMVANDAPWVLTVGAGTTDRRIAVSIKLGDGTELAGESAYQPSPFNSTTPFPLAFPKRGCSYDSFKDIDVSGKIVLCESGFGFEENIEKGKIVKNAGGAAMVVLNRAEQGETTLSEAHVLPAAHVGYSASCSIESYFNSSTDSTPYVTLTFIGTILGARPSPAVASFSSRGPSSNNGGILKPDIIGPGVNILGAWPAGDLSATSDQESNFNFQSGTSSATPHLSGIAALLRSSHHHWSPSAIKSAIVTTANREDADGNPITDQFNVTTAAAAASLFAVGAGQVDPSKANNPGLVYNLHSHSYKRYLCGLGYTDRQVTMITLHHAKCSRYRRELGPEQLNYPSITVALGSPARKTVRRWVRNVGEDSEVYVAKIDMPEGVKVEVYPPRLYFARRYDTRRFVVVLTADDRKLRSSGRVKEGQLLWVSSSHVVKSPIVVTFT